jgi:2-C-methyl-D-erythritol 2,4-cyclodiphosphate synthase
LKSGSNIQNAARFGFGYDVHRFVEGRKLILGGVEVPYSKGLQGHSEADILLHALVDPLLSAAALGDIGKHFPDTDQRYKDISSLILLKHVAEMLSQNRYVVINVDATIVLENPKIGSYIDVMRQNISSTLRILPQQVSIKATTHEGLGFVGSGEGAVAHAVASIIQQ